MSVIRLAIKEKDMLEEKNKSTSSDYNRFRLLEEVLFDYQKDSDMDCEEFKDIYYGRNTKIYYGAIKKEYNRDYYLEEIVS